jgi:hypothetical protein
MDTEEKRKLDRVLALSEENNSILKKMLRNQRWARLVRIIYWALIIAAAAGLFYWIQPYLEQIVGVYSGTNSAISDLLQN